MAELDRTPAPRARLWALDLAYALCIALLFVELLLGDARLIARDLVQYFYPFGQLFADALAGQGSLLWDPGVNHGMPLAARWSAAVFYPPHWLLAVLRPENAIAIAVLAHLQLAASAMLRLARRYSASLGGAWIGGLTYALSGYLLSMVGGGTYLYGAALLPLSLLALHRLCEVPTLGRTLQLALVLALQIFNPDPQTLFYELLCLVPLVLWLRAAPGQRRRALGAIAAAGLLALLVAWCQLWPTFEVAAFSVRASGLSYAESSAWSLHPLRLIEWLVPGAFGGLAPDLTYWSPLPASGPGYGPWAISVHLGAAALVGLFALTRADRRAALAWGGVSALFLLLAAGAHTPLYRALLWLPGADRFRYPEKHMLFVTLGIALLAAVGVGRLVERLRGRGASGALRRPLYALVGFSALLALARSLLLLGGRERLEQAIAASAAPVDPAAAAAASIAAVDRALVLLLALLALLLLRRWLRPGLAAALLLALFAADLVLAGLPLRKLGGRDWLAARTPLCTAIASAAPVRPLLWRDAQLAYRGDPPGLRGPVSSAERHRRWERFTGLPNVASSCGRYARGYDAASLLPHTRLLKAIADPHRAADLLGVQHLIGAAAARLGPGYRLRAELRDWRIAIHDNLDALPYAHAVGGAHHAANLEQALARVGDAGFDFRNALVLEAARPAASYAPARRTARVLRHQAGAIALRTDYEQPGYLLLLESHFPGWKAWIDERPATVLRANAAFLGLAIPPGAHDVRLAFEPERQQLGNRVSLVGLLACCALLGLCLVRRVRRR